MGDAKFLAILSDISTVPLSLAMACVFAQCSRAPSAAAGWARPTILACGLASLPATHPLGLHALTIDVNMNI